MLKVLVVDDEKPARDKLTYLIEWEETPFKIIDFAKNGKEALEKYIIYEPDLIITDISMPIMDGLELIKKIKEISVNQRFIILSCHENFNYAKEAMKLGVADYLIKDLVTSDELYSVLEKVRIELENREDKRGHTLTNEKNIFPSIDFSLQYKAIALRSIVFNNLSREQYLDLSGQFQLKLKEDRFSLMLIRLDNYKHMESSYTHQDFTMTVSKILMNIESSINNYYSGECFYDGNGQIIVLFNLPYLKSNFKYISEVYQIANEVKYNIQQMGYGDITSAIYHESCQLSNVYGAYCKLLEIIKYSFFVGSGSILFSNMSIPKIKPNVPELLEENIRFILVYTEKLDKHKVTETIKTIYKEDLMGFMQYNYINHVNTQLLNIILEGMKAKHISYEELFGCQHIPFDVIAGFNEVGEVSKWFCGIFEKLIDKSIMEPKPCYSKRIGMAVSYIDKNYLKDISLTTIADHIGVHKVYLSRIFKEETGENVTDYIIQYRIKKAIQMMRLTDLKLYEVAEQAGFKDARQFSIYFKKVIGLTPIEYRDKEYREKLN